MDRRRQREFRDETTWGAMKEIALAVADSPTAEVLGQAIMDVLDRMVGCDLGSILSVRPGRPWSTAGLVGGITDNRLVENNFWRYCAEMSSAELAYMSGHFVPAVQVFEARRRERLAVFHEFLWPRGLNHVLVGELGHRCSSVGHRTDANAIRGARTDCRASQRDPAPPPGGAAISGLVVRRRAHPGPIWCQASRARPRPALGAHSCARRLTELVIRGLTNNEIAGLLGTSTNTVRNTLVEVFRKVGASRRAELAFLVTNVAVDGTARVDPRELEKQRGIVATLAGSGRSRRDTREQAGRPSAAASMID